MPHISDVAAHYSTGSLLGKIESALKSERVRMPLDIDVLAPVDEFHIGGRQATIPFLANMNISAGDRVLDLGCGLGGPARFTARTTGAHVTGIDLTEEFVETGRVLTGLAVLLDRVTLIQGSILDLPFEDNSFDAAYMIHVGMNIDDKSRLASEVARVLRPGATLGVYDVMKMSDSEIDYPVPWASGSDQCAVAPPSDYRLALAQAGFAIQTEIDRTEFARDFFAKLAEAEAEARAEGPGDGPGPLGLHLVMGPDTRAKIANMVSNVMAGHVAPIEIIARLTKHDKGTQTT